MNLLSKAGLYIIRQLKEQIEFVNSKEHIDKSVFEKIKSGDGKAPTISEMVLRN